MPAFSVFIMVPFNLLTVRILGQDRLAKPMLVSLRVTLGIALALTLIVPFLNYSTALSIAFVFSTLHLLLLLFVTGSIAKNKRAKARMLFICILSLLIIFIYKCALLFSLSSNFTQPNILFGCCYLFSCVVLTLIAIFDHIKQRDIKVALQQQRLAESKANEAIQSETIKLQNQHQEELESKIQQRTFELEITLRELQEKNSELEELNTKDTLTGLRNRRHFDKKIQMEFRRSRREHTSLTVVMLDIDHFKSINDKYGHLTGDEAIKYVASVMKEAVRRPSDIACRYGGEEFALILANTDIKGAKLISEKILQAISTFTMQTDMGALNFTISAGIFCQVADASLEPNQYTYWADKALYEAKEQGRNRVCIADVPKSSEEFK
jgi:diguanylate cyclase (GGDEF)-like protein